MVGSDRQTCPACGSAVADDAWCAAWGLELGGTEARELSALMAQLAEAGYITLRKAALDGRQRTWAALTREGGAP